MTVQELQEQIRQLDDTEFQRLLAWVVTPERERRQAQPAIEQAKQEAASETATKISQQLAEEHPELVEKAAGEEDGEVREWEPWHPLRESTHYRYGDKTRHGGKVWRDVLDPTGDKLNVWEPGALGIDERYWVEVELEAPAEETPADGAEDTPAQDSGADEPTLPTWRPGVAYLAGEEILYEGRRYRVIQGHTSQTSWAPDAAHSLFQEVKA
ncbi:carbohydrate-binding protein [Corynebacterium sp. 11254D000AR]